jgi:hypothetical protein
MEDDSTKGPSENKKIKNNVVKGPWLDKKEMSNLYDESKKIAKDIELIDDITGQMIIPMIHKFSEEGFDLTSPEFLKEIGCINEVVKSMLYRNFGYGHSMSIFIDNLMIAKDGIISVDKDMVEDILDFMEENYEQPIE